MTFSTMNDLALIAIGAGLGLALALIAAIAYSLLRAASALRAEHASSIATLTRHLADSVAAAVALRSDLTAALARLDADRLYAASVSLQRSARSLGQTTQDLQRAVFAQPGSPALDLGYSGLSALDDEAAADSRAAQDRVRYASERGRWSAADQPRDPLAGLSEEDRAARVSQFFAQRQRDRAAAGDPAIYSPFAPQTATPPAPGSGAYAAMMEQVTAAPPPPAAPAPDFSTFEQEGVDLAEKGELD